jgi:hypothetical protein
MASISVTFRNNTDASAKWTIFDTGIDPANPALVFSDYLDKDASTVALPIYADDFGAGHVQYQGGSGAQQLADVRDGDTVAMQ